MARIRGRSRKVRIVMVSHLSHLVVDLHKCVKNFIRHQTWPVLPTKEVSGRDTCNIHLERLGGPPAVIFNRVLATLQPRLDHLEQIEVDRAEVNRAARYLRCAVKFYEASETLIKRTRLVSGDPLLKLMGRVKSN